VAGPRLTARDYKKPVRRGAAGNRLRDIGIGLGAGLAIALAIWVGDHRRKEPPIEGQPQPRTPSKAKAVAATEPEEPAPQYDFYDMLPKFEVVVPEQDHDAKRDLPSVAVEQPGAYVLQVGSYRNQADAARLREKLAKQGIDASIQRVAVDDDVWHRVRIGPFRDLDKLNATRRELRAADIDAILLRVPD
jgi:cell division protein FtsN